MVAGINEDMIFINSIFNFLVFISIKSIIKKNEKKNSTGSQINTAKGRKNNL
jgi:hypothetical protein